jgi:hypothetical protein
MLFSWLMSLSFLFGNSGYAVRTPSTGFASAGDGHVLPADNPQPNAAAPANVDGGGGKGGG